MPLYKFGPNDVYHNTIKAHPSCSFFIYDEQVFYNNRTSISGAWVEGHSGINKTGYINLYELNIDRNDYSVPPEDESPLGTIGSDGVVYKVENNGRIYAYTVKQSDQSEAFKTITADQFTDTYQIGDVMTASYSMSASIAREFYPVNHADTFSNFHAKGGNNTLGCIYTSDALPIEEHVRILKTFASGSHIDALRTRLDYNSILSDHYHYTASGADAGSHWDKSKQAVNLVSIPSIFYGSEIKKGSVSLKYFISGTLVGELQDINRNGELIQVEPSQGSISQGSGNVAGVVMYNEGFVVLTGSWALGHLGAGAPTFNDRDIFGATVSNVSPSWLRFAHGVSDGRSAGPLGHEARSTSPLGRGTNPSSSYLMEFLGTSHISTISMMAHAKKGELNWSNNPSFISSSASSSYVSPQAGGYRYYERELKIKNIVSSSYSRVTGSFERITYISKVGIYDKDKNLIAVASVANPVKKTEDRDLTFKLKLDI
tara:strand:+ start:434 stop:1891 length:1458 start_codon:yes stop_codon:yes gene_type:complete